MEQLATLDHQVQLRAIAVALERICRVNRDLRSSAPTVFDAVAVPAMSIHCYLVRLHRYTKFDFVCFHVAAWYLAKLCQTPEGSAYCPTLHNIHRLLIAALLVASKATDGARKPFRPSRRPPGPEALHKAVHESAAVRVGPADGSRTRAHRRTQTRCRRIQTHADARRRTRTHARH